MLTSVPLWGLPSVALAQEEQPAPRLLDNLLTRMAVKVDLTGDHSALFVIDTGAEKTSVSDDLARRLELQAAAPVLVHGITASQIVPTALLPSFHLSGRRFSRLNAPVFPHSLLGADGLLGLDVLSRFRLTLDLRRRRVMMAASGPDVVERGIAFGRASRVRPEISDSRAGRYGQLFLTRLIVGHVRAIAFIDTGAQYSIANQALKRAMAPYGDITPEAQVRVYGVIGQSLMAEAGTVSSLRLAGRELGPTPLLFADLHAFSTLGLMDQPALLIGADIISRFGRITLDYGRGQISLSQLMPSVKPA